MALAWSMRQRAGIDAVSAAHKQKGMTVHDVAAILGDPPGDYSTLVKSVITNVSNRGRDSLE